ncbi:MAG: site-2 protease family protein [Patescibacteria group bacterium]
MILDIAIFIIVLAVLVLAHEFGHFLAARKNGVRVDEFGFGFPPRLFGFKRGQTLYSLNLFPLGGFVKIAGENEAESSDSENFASKSLFSRASILFAGVFFNIVLAFIIFSVVVPLGIPVDAEDPYWQLRVRDTAITVVEVLKGSSAELAGFKTGDRVLTLETISGGIIKPSHVFEVQDFTRANAGQSAIIEIERRGQKIVLSANLAEGEAPLGVATAKVGKIASPWYAVPWVGLELTAFAVWRTLEGFFFILKLLFSGQSVAGFISGPVGIFSLVSGILDFGPVILMTFVATLSINLAIINLMPFPALDGGRLLFLMIEGLRGKPLSRRIGGLAHALGFAILIMLMAIITYLDIKYKL